MHCLGKISSEKNEQIKDLVKKLSGSSEKETLTNILQWQHENLTFWKERDSVDFIILLVLTVLSVSLGTILDNFLLLAFGLILLTVSVAAFVNILLMLDDRHLSFRNKIKIFYHTLPIDFLLENKLGLCRDYAKLTKFLLSEIYPDKDISNIEVFRHVATRIKINNHEYVLDQHLPIVTYDQWKKTNSFFQFMQEFEKIDIEKLGDKMSSNLNMKKITEEHKAVPLKSIKWKKGARLYKDNEIVNYSLERMLKIESSKTIDINKIGQFKIEQNEKDDLFFNFFP